MDKTGSVSRIADAVININFGRKGFAIRRKAEEDVGKMKKYHSLFRSRKNSHLTKMLWNV